MNCLLHSVCQCKPVSPPPHTLRSFNTHWVRWEGTLFIYHCCMTFDPKLQMHMGSPTSAPCMLPQWRVLEGHAGDRNPRAFCVHSGLVISDSPIGMCAHTAQCVWCAQEINADAHYHYSPSQIEPIGSTQYPFHGKQFCVGCIG